ncbi:MAG TPA: prepilin-type N-terminal cleavage/methylation domain-containing protein [Acetivibrio sp.]|nr:prepilin-type N-terminal cleavage/methylation domain-containing protein [Acetivibrio sp.]
MKKMLKNKKGFSLVELVIVIAIMGVLAAVAISMFTGMIQRSRKRADDVRAQQIQKAIVTYIAETGDSDLSELNLGGNTLDDLLSKLQIKHTITLPNGTTEDFGPYLENIKNQKAATNYYPQQEDSDGWQIDVDSQTGDVQVQVVIKGGTATKGLNIN